MHEHQHEHCKTTAANLKQDYDKVPEDYTGMVYTCPMHPEVRSTRADACPICGMGLEPATISLDEEDDSELRDMSRRFWVGVVFSVPVLLAILCARLALAERLEPEYVHADRAGRCCGLSVQRGRNRGARDFSSLVS
jgi:Cu+-exporting ATPase